MDRLTTPVPHHLPLGQADASAYRARLRRDGFFVTPPQFSAAALGWADSALAQLMAVCRAAPGSVNGIALTESAGRRHVTGISRIYEHLGSVALYLLGHPAVAALAQLACGEDAVPTHDWMVIKNAGDGHAVGWHQDFIHSGEHTAINIGIHLDGASEDAVCFIPGSHTGPQSIARYAQRYHYDSPGVVRAEVARGGLAVHNVLAVHGSPPLRQQRCRRTLYIEFRPAAHAKMPPDYLLLRRRLHSAAQQCYRALGATPAGPPPSLTVDAQEILQALDAMQVRIEPANYG